MEPDEYFPGLYVADLESSFEGATILCGFSLCDADKNRDKVKHYEDLYCCIYSLNLINQLILVYFKKEYRLWYSKTPAFPDLHHCDHYHGGIFYPHDLLRHIKVRRDVLSKYLRFFIFEYVDDLGLDSVSSGKLVSYIEKDENYRLENKLISVL